MARRDVVRGDVAAPPAAAEGHRRIESGRQADGAVSGWRVDTDPEGRFAQTELQDDILVFGMDGHRMAHSAVAQDLDAAFTTLPPVADDVPRQDRAEFFN